MNNPLVREMLEQIRLINDRKSGDYTSSDPYENFKRSMEIIGWFKNDEDKVFITLIATKLARLATLLNSGKTPNNESITDSFLDLSTYSILWATYHKSKKPTVGV